MLVTLAISNANTDQDTFLTEQINTVSDVIQAYCRRVFASTAYVQTYYLGDYDWSKTLETFHYPLVSVASIVEDGVTLDPTLYRINLPTGTVTKTCGYFYQALETVVTYTAGLAATPTPVKGVVYSIVQERYNKKNSGVDLNFGSDVQRISIPGTISIDFDYSLSNNDRKSAFGVVLGSQSNVLDYYRSDRAVVGNGKLIYL